jgi:hypothetical protein
MLLLVVIWNVIEYAMIWNDYTIAIWMNRISMIDYDCDYELKWCDVMIDYDVLNVISIDCMNVKTMPTTMTNRIDCFVSMIVCDCVNSCCATILMIEIAYEMSMNVNGYVYDDDYSIESMNDVLIGCVVYANEFCGVLFLILMGFCCFYVFAWVMVMLVFYLLLFWLRHRCPIYLHHSLEQLVFVQLDVLVLRNSILLSQLHVVEWVLL